MSYTKLFTKGYCGKVASNYGDFVSQIEFPVTKQSR